MLIILNLDGTNANLQSCVKKGKINEEKFLKTLSLLKGAVIENVSLKPQIFSDLEKYCPPHCILPSNTSTIDLNLIGEKTRSHDGIIGAHFFSPAHIMPLLEIVRTEKTSPQDCIGALDETHVMARVSQEYATSYYGRKGVPTQNIIVVCDFNLCFTFVSADWDGSMHDSQVLHYVTTEPKHRFSHPAPSKKY
ncbi:hypothetical protein HYC85_006280 [Camellia sinensis]|uniref:3-hydroxyacyl-CoA dehydrogenase NAD binding domain-containing protein n=1 Tax=Camellia sinensis TaxID=4442 RepID=A0A7J7HN74_CAMSI|nr:hypothetical protein HYC85_006280 [Camellia sinensis]